MKEDKYDILIGLLDLVSSPDWTESDLRFGNGYLCGIRHMIHCLPDNEDLIKALDEVDKCWDLVMLKLRESDNDLPPRPQISCLNDAIHRFCAEWDMYRQLQHDWTPPDIKEGL